MAGAMPRFEYPLDLPRELLLEFSLDLTADPVLVFRDAEETDIPVVGTGSLYAARVR
jgi:hypothetical protein